MRVKFVLSVVIAALVVPFPSAFGQTSTSAEHRIAEPISINGQSAQGVLVVLNGAVQTYSCPAPAQYVATGSSDSGWACFEPETGMWLLHAAGRSFSDGHSDRHLFEDLRQTVPFCLDIFH